MQNSDLITKIKDSYKKIKRDTQVFNKSLKSYNAPFYYDNRRKMKRC